MNNHCEENNINDKWFDKLINTIVCDESFKYWHVEKKNRDGDGDNYLGKLYEIDISGVTDNKEKEINLFVKEKIDIKTQFVRITPIYNNENFVYNTLSDVFIDLQKEFQIPDEERYKFAKAYKNISDNVVILENLTKKGFTTYHRMDTFTLPYATLAVKQLAKLHALSFVLEYNNREFFEMCKTTFKPPFLYTDEWKGAIHNIYNTITNLLDSNSKKLKLHKFETVHINKFPKYNVVDLKRKCCLTHCDYRISNVMVREKDGVPVEVLPVDYQLMEYGCPIRDFIFFTITGSTQEFRRNHLDEIKETYFEAMTKFLKYFNLDIETVYPRVEFETAYKEWLDFGLMMGLLMAVLFFLPDSDKLDHIKVSLVDMSFKIDERGKKRIVDLIDDYIEWGYL